MKSVTAFLAMASMLAANAFAADPNSLNSPSSPSSQNPPKAPIPMSGAPAAGLLIDVRTAEKIWKENTPARVSARYPTRKFRFVSEMTGGFNESKLCVVTARVMLLPVQGRKVVYAPLKTATAFDAVPGLSREQCQDLARGKLKEAIQSIASALAAG